MNFHLIMHDFCYVFLFSTNFYNFTTKALIANIFVWELFYLTSYRILQREV